MLSKFKTFLNAELNNLHIIYVDDINNIIVNGLIDICNYPKNIAEGIVDYWIIGEDAKHIPIEQTLLETLFEVIYPFIKTNEHIVQHEYYGYAQRLFSLFLVN